MLSFFTRLLNAQPNTGCAECAKRGKYTLLNAAADTLRGDFASDAVRDSRLAICKSCEYLVMGSNCRLCGCFVHLKARYAAASCDIHKW
ncbi:MAG: hypothetical protein OHK0011_04700 [Turneriella sp.]